MDGARTAVPKKGGSRRSMAGTDRQINVEQSALAAIYQEFDTLLAATRDELADVLRTTPETAGEVQEREVAAARLTRRSHGLQAAEQGLCFGRIDQLDGTVLRIGRTGLRMPGGELPLLVDWRAEAARPFYAATARQPLGVRRRRHLRVDGRTVIGLADEILDGSPPTADDVLGDGPLAEALAEARTGRMRAAISTLQEEQDAIVRSASKGITVVQGGPGTGKTIVALHRAAYVLYAFPRATQDGVLVVGPDRRFLDYISEVLPSLGENDVVLATRDDLLDPGLRVVPEDEQTARIKGHRMLADGLARWVRSKQPQPVPVTITVGQERLRLHASVIAEARAVASGLAHNEARAAFKEHVVSELVNAVERRTVESLEQIDAEVASLVGIDLDKAAAADLDALGFTDDAADAMDETFDREAVQRALGADAQVDTVIEGLWPQLRPSDVVRGLLTDEAALSQFLPAIEQSDRELLLRTPEAPWTRADLPLLDEARALVDGPPERIFGHVVVDEAQDVTDMEWRMITRRCPTRSMTVVGDFAQAGPSSVHNDWQEIFRPFVGAPLDVHTLTVNYRTTAEILGCTRELLAAIAPEQSLSASLRHGESPRTLTTSDGLLIETLVRELLTQREAQPGELAGVICSAQRADLLAATAIADHAEMVPAGQVRGREFDTVIVVAPDEIVAARSSGQRDLYVALTRATKRLCIVELTRSADL
ncbi:HelD family protein [Micromonospora sp. NPDC007230]|uniref:HelD family protein n=1 Tax=Micromonospora sp. NPDC007230 TaxID=3364237 RepID=UPI0036A4B234